ncbi:hypothetical protein BDN70DRAFT_896427 [Pholiota conissans]|uniref:Uncharacterized protein n=1 Tax=Pholiota conissans TaxID=109636 RepID=A0A9P6CYQ4_9AGAR|nr:hypothetical protein BDN70DRAFT_896427 [Pholiota conissans]
MSNGRHTITVDQLDQTALDMVLVTVGPNTSLAGRTFLWIAMIQPFNIREVKMRSSRGKYHQITGTVGDTMTFQFMGTAVSVYENIGIISATYTHDDSVQSQSYPVTFNSPQHINSKGQDVNFLFFASTLITAANHTLVVNITEIRNPTFVFDYITYSPSFLSLATMSNPAAAYTSSINAPQIDMGVKKAPTGVIASACVGGIFLLILVIAMIVCLGRRIKRYNIAVHPSPFPEEKVAIPYMFQMPLMVICSKARWILRKIFLLLKVLFQSFCPPAKLE